MNKFKFFLSFSLCLCFTLCLNAQEEKVTDKVKDIKVLNSPLQNTKKGEKLYEDYGYKTSIPHFESSAEYSSEDLVKIANSYRLVHDTENAELWYSQVIDVTDKPLYKLYYAQALQSNRNYELAKKYYLEYDRSVAGEVGADERGKILANAIDRMNDFSHTSTKIRNESEINTDKLDFSPTYHNNGVVFVSTRENDSKKAKGTDIWINDNFMSLFYAKKSEATGLLSSTEEFSHDITTKFHEGPVTFSKSGNRIFFTRNNYNKGKRRNDDKGVMKLKIYTASKDGEDWGTAEELPWNTDKHEECHPTLSADGKTLYFSSDREGGFGGMDLYSSEFKGGKWNTPKNLGKKVNTAGNEVFPFIHDDGTLYYASNGWGGLGGLDIFSTTKIEEEKWAKAENIGTPFNSPKDDFGFIMNVTRTEGYLTSARDNGNGQDDIYSFILPADAFANKSMAKVCAFEEGNEDNRLEGVVVTVTEKMVEKTGQTLVNNQNELVLKVTPTAVVDEYDFRLKMKNDMVPKTEELFKPRDFNTDKIGEFYMAVRPDREYHLVAKKDGFIVAEETYTTGETIDANAIEICVPVPLAKLEVEEPVVAANTANCLMLEGTVVNEKYGNVIGNATVTMVNLCSGEEVQVASDAKGFFSFPCIPCGCEFALKGEKKNFKFGIDNASSMNSECDKPGVIKTKIPLNPSLSGSEVFAAIAPPENNLTVGSVIELENIYYDFDQFYIRDDARGDLENIIALMTKFPGMEIELGSHTDSRGTTSYNANLSQNRANAARQYIIQRGIDSRRLTAHGYGESQLRNRCKNFVECDETDHQLNRRTEVKITRFDRKDVQVLYKDDGPQRIDRADPKRAFVWD